MTSLHPHLYRIGNKAVFFYYPVSSHRRFNFGRTRRGSDRRGSGFIVYCWDNRNRANRRMRRGWRRPLLSHHSSPPLSVRECE